MERPLAYVIVRRAKGIGIEFGTYIQNRAVTRRALVLETV